MSAPFRLRVESGPNAGQDYTVAGSGTTIGRQDGNTIVLDDGRLSRQHARIDLAPGGLTITDLGSANGTRLNGQRISGTQPLRPGDRVQLGETTIVVEGGPPTADVGGSSVSDHAGGDTVSDSPPGGSTPRLVVQSTGRSFPLDRPSLIIGRQPGIEITLEDTQASRQHARFDVHGDQITITDLGSANGTRVNGTPITVPTVLRDGDILQIGTSLLRIEGLGGAAGLPPAFGALPLAPPSDATVVGGPPSFGPAPNFGSPADPTVRPGMYPPAGPPPLIGPPTVSLPPVTEGQSWNSPPPPQFGGAPPPVAGVPMPPPTQSRQASRLPLILGAVVGVLLLLCVGGGVGGALLLRGRSASPTQTTTAASPQPSGSPIAGNFGTPTIVGTTAPIAGSGGGNPAPPPPGATVAPTVAPTVALQLPPTARPSTAPSTGPRPSTAPSAGPRPSTAPSSGPRASAPPATGGAQAFSVTSVGLKFSLPAGWTQDQNEAGKASFLSPDRRAVIVVRWSTQVPAGLTAQRIIQNELDVTAQTDANFDPTATGTGNVTFGGQPGFGSEAYTYTTQNGQSVTEVDRAVVLAGRAQYFFGFSALEESFDGYADIFDQIIGTVVITGP